MFLTRMYSAQTRTTDVLLRIGVERALLARTNTGKPVLLVATRAGCVPEDGEEVAHAKALARDFMYGYPVSVCVCACVSVSCVCVCVSVCLCICLCLSSTGALQRGQACAAGGHEGRLCARGGRVCQCACPRLYVRLPVLLRAWVCVWAWVVCAFLVCMRVRVGVGSVPVCVTILSPPCSFQTPLPPRAPLRPSASSFCTNEEGTILPCD